MHVCLFMHLWQGDGHSRDGGAVHVCTDVGRLEIDLSYKLPYLREVGFLSDMSTLVTIDWQAKTTQGVTHFCLSSVAITNTHHHAWSLPGFWGMDSGLHDCTVNTT